VSWRSASARPPAAPSPPRSRSSPRLGYRPALDGLRAVAALLVLLCHAWTPRFPGGGAVGVDVFFVLSGFLITTILLEEMEATGTVRLRTFYVKRLRRLWPALLVMVAVVALAAPVVAPGLAAATDSGVPSVLTYTANFTKASHPTDSLALLAHTWSLSMEEQFYLLWPLALVGLVRWRGPRVALHAVLVGIAVVTLYRLQLWDAGAPAGRLFFAPDTHSDALLAGCALGLARPLSWPRQRLIGLAGATALTACVLVASSGQLPVFSITAAGSVALITASLFGRSPLTWQPMVWLGRRSYGIYLWHFPIVIALIDRGMHPGPLLAALVAAASIILAAVSYRYVEQPLLRPALIRAVRTA
jgi:peptidoglycan/LPS O-acetylase OafA/YrhL